MTTFQEPWLGATETWEPLRDEIPGIQELAGDDCWEAILTTKGGGTVFMRCENLADLFELILQHRTVTRIIQVYRKERGEPL